MPPRPAFVRLCLLLSAPLLASVAWAQGTGVPTALVDPTFNVTPAFNRAPVAAVEQPDLKVIFGGDFISLVNGFGQSGLARVNADGSLDPTFRAGSGLGGFEATATCLALQPDGKVLVGGTFSAVDGVTRPGLARLLASGGLDFSFSPPASLAAQPIGQIVVQTDGKILVVDRSGQLLRLLADGTVDPTFRSPPPTSPTVQVALQSTGKIIACQGFFGSSHSLLRLNADGSTDATFPATTLGQPGVAALRVLRDDRIAVASQFRVTFGGWALERFTAAGQRDPSFAVQTGTLNRSTGTFAIADDGRVIYQVTVNTTTPPSEGTALRRLNLDGTIDSTFRAASSTPIVGLTSIVPLAGGRSLLLGTFTAVDGVPRLGVARLVAANATASAPPGIASTSPQSVTVQAGDPVTLSFTPSGSGPFTVRWSSPSGSAGEASTDGTRFTIRNAQQSGTYGFTLTNAGGTTIGPSFQVIVTPALPRAVSAPGGIDVNTGRTAIFTAEVRGSEPITYQWFFNSAPVGTDSPTLTLTDVTASQAGVYTLVARNALGTVTPAAARLTVDATSRLANLATRGLTGTGENILTAGFALTGPVPRTVIIRGVGPGLGAFGLSGLLADPQIALFDSSGTLLAANDNWTSADSGATSALFQRWGAFALASGSRDAALVRTLPPGAYSVQVSGVNGTTGLALAEVYEADPLPSRLINLSSRLVVGSGTSVAIPGIVVSGTAPRKLLIRAVGPGLGVFGVKGFLADPFLTLTKADGTVVATGDDWSAVDNLEAKAAGAAVGAFYLTDFSKDSVLLVTIPPGNYTAQVKGADGGSGVALIEVYEVP